MRKTRWLHLGLLGALVAVSLLSACGDDETKGPGPFTELLFVSDAFTVRAFDTSGGTFSEVSSAAVPGMAGTYTRSGTTVTVTLVEHWLSDGLWVDLAFGAGTGGTATSGKYTVTVVDADTFTVTDTASGTITAGTVTRKPVTTLTGTYSQAGTTVTITLPGHGFASGWDLKLDYTSGAAVDTVAEVAIVVDADSFTVTAASTATATGNVTVLVGANYAIFGMAMHPSGRWLYATSTYECWSGDPLCWGDGLISRFAIDWETGGLSYQGSIRQDRGYAAPVGLTFSPDGALLFVQDDNLDGVDMFRVDAGSGDLEYLASTANSQARLHGLVVSPAGTRLYNGLNVYSFDGGATPSITQINASTLGANSCAIVGGVLFSTIRESGQWYLRTYDLATPDAPQQIATISTNAINQAREIVVSADGGLVVGAGFGGLKSYTYAAGVLAAAPGAGAEYIDGGGAVWPGNTEVRKMFRSLTRNAAGNRLAAAYFTNDPNSGTFGGLPPAGVILFSLAADGTIAKLADSGQGTYNRVARFYTRP